MCANLSQSKKAAKNSLINDAVIKVNPEEVIFALDIGTRTVIGIVGIQEKGKFKVLAADIIEHKRRAMIDGQIHDIAEVAQVAKEMKERLEKKLGFNLTKVAVAAAGRVLKTCEVKVEIECDATKEIDRELISSLEVEGIQKAQISLDSEMTGEEKSQFYCVGYSVINYYLNGYVISELAGHKGKKVGADILATFLPHVVVDSMYTVMSRVGLEIINLTLEPIAAINVTIPKDLRLLNLALVDIGAGTSDIAITKNGSVVAYGMAPIAGDEITEKIAQHYLVDFNTAEKIKISLSEKTEKITFTDILNTKRNISVSEVMEVIKPSIEFLAKTISEKILEYNHKAPNAVFLIGGGSQIPGLTGSISSLLEIPNDRVVVRGREVISGIKFSSKRLAGPEAITPFGIAVTAQMQRGQDFMNVTVNGQNIRLFNSKKLIVADALGLVGFDPRKLIGRTGKSINYDLNGVKKTVRGEVGKSAQIFVNDKLASLETVLNTGDNITVTPAEDGANACLKVGELVKNSSKRKVSLNGTDIPLETKIFINGKAASIEEDVHDGDNVIIDEIVTIDDLLRVCEIDTSSFDISVNGENVMEGYVLQDSDAISYTAKNPYKSIISDNLFTGDSLFSDEDGDEEVKDVFAGGKRLDIVVNGESKSIHSESSQFIFVDIFNYLDFDLSNPQGNIVLKLNGRKAGFTDVIKPGDVIDIYWDKLT